VKDKPFLILLKKLIYSPNFLIGVMLFLTGYLFWERPINLPVSDKELSTTRFYDIEFLSKYRSVPYSVRVFYENGDSMVLMPDALNEKNREYLTSFVEKVGSGRVGWFNKCSGNDYSLYVNRCNILMTLDDGGELLIRFEDSLRVLKYKKSGGYYIFLGIPYFFGMIFIMLALFSVFFDTRK